MDNFKKYSRKPLSSEMRPYVEGEDMTGISLSEADKLLPTLVGGFISRNPVDHFDQWYVAKEYFDKHFNPTPHD